MVEEGQTAPDFTLASDEARALRFRISEGVPLSSISTRGTTRALVNSVTARLQRRSRLPLWTFQAERVTRAFELQIEHPTARNGTRRVAARRRTTNVRERQ